MKSRAYLRLLPECCILVLASAFLKAYLRAPVLLLLILRAPVAPVLAHAPPVGGVTAQLYIRRDSDERFLVSLRH